MPTLRRRDVLAGAGAALGASLAGCSGVLCRGVAGDVELSNDHDAAHAVRLRFEGPESLDRSYDLDAGESRTDEGVFTEAGEYSVSGLVDGEEVDADEASIAYDEGSECPRGDGVQLRIDGDGAATLSAFHAD